VDGTPHFNRLAARDLTGRTCWIPDVFAGERNLIFVAFRRQQQSMIDSWNSWLMTSFAESGYCFYEVPVLAQWWAPVRSIIDGGMATAVLDQKARQMTLTIYGNVSRITRPLDIGDRSTVSIFLTDHKGNVLDRATGSFDEETAERLLESARR
jgi:hypothetical protein